MYELTNDQRKFLAASTLVAFGTAISITFFNLFLFKLMDNNIFLMAFLQVFKFTFIVIGSIIGTYMARKYKMSTINGIGLIGLIFTILIALVSGDFARNNLNLFVIIIGTLWGLGEGFYWMSFNSLQQIIVLEHTRASFLGINGGLTNIASIFAPLLSTLLISAYGNLGYFGIFILVMINYFLAFLITNTLQINSMSTDCSKPPNWKMLLQHKSIKYDFWCNTIYGLREGFILGFLSIVYMQILQNNEIIFGVFNTINALIVVFSNFIFARLFKESIKARNVIFIMLPLCFVGIYFGFTYSVLACLLFGVVYNFLNPAYLIIMAMRTFSIIDVLSENEEEKFIGLTFREVGLSVGRCISMFLLVALYHILGDSSFSLWLIISHLIFIILMFFYYKIYKSSQNHIFTDIE